MFAEMTPGAKHSLLISVTGNRRAVRRQQKRRSEKTCYFSESKDQSRTKSPSLWNCLTFCFKDQPTMEQREPAVASQAEGTEGRLGEVDSKCLIDTLIAHNVLCPTWFLGFTSRKGAEEILKGKVVGCFLIRRSDKAIGYILSYKGGDRCRHFVINQSESGHFVICGDPEEHDTVSDLIEHYKTRPIQPFGEYLTSPCFEVLNEEFYDTIQDSPKENAVASASAVKNVHKQRIKLASEQPPTRPPRSANSRLVEEASPLPRWSSAPLNDQNEGLYAQVRKKTPKEIPRLQHIPQDSKPRDNPGRAERSTTQNIRRCSSSCGPDSPYAEHGLLDGNNLSVPLLDASSDVERPYSLGASHHTPPRLYPKATREATCYGPEKSDPSSRPSSSHSLDYMSDNALYHLAGRPGNFLTALSETRSEQHWDSEYAEVHTESLVGRSPRANQLIAGHEDTVKRKTNSNSYESLEDIRPKHNPSTWRFKDDKWRWLFPDAHRK